MKRKILAVCLIGIILFLGYGPVTSEGSTWKLLTARWGSGAGEIDDIRIDGATNSLQTVSFGEQKVHVGSSFGCISLVDLANGAVLDLQITTPNTTKWLHFTISYDTESETLFEIYENVTINMAGTTLVPIHHNRNKTGTASGIAAGGLASIENTSTANAESDTDTIGVGAILLASGISGAGKDGGDDSHEHEWILKQDETYTLRWTANAAGYVDYHLEWYEHTDLH